MSRADDLVVEHRAKLLWAALGNASTTIVVVATLGRASQRWPPTPARRTRRSCWW